MRFVRYCVTVDSGVAFHCSEYCSASGRAWKLLQFECFAFQLVSLINRFGMGSLYSRVCVCVLARARFMCVCVCYGRAHIERERKNTQWALWTCINLYEFELVTNAIMIEHMDHSEFHLWNRGGQPTQNNWPWAAKRDRVREHERTHMKTKGWAQR